MCQLKEEELVSAHGFIHFSEGGGGGGVVNVCD